MSYFSVPFHLITKNQPLAYDLYVNSSVLETKERFVKIFKQNEILTATELETFKNKYHQLYVSEKQRSNYLNSLAKIPTANEIEKTAVIKDSAIKYLGSLFDKNKEFTTEILVETINECKETVAAMVNVIKDYQVKDIQKLISNLSFHDFYTFDHSINVSMYCIGLFKSFKPDATNEELTMAGLGGLLHDLGKIKISTEIINKPEKLSNEEFEIIKKHPSFGLELLKEHECHCEGVNIDTLSRIIYEHHENYNGTGYPQKISGDNIHLLARITAIADFFDAITTKRSYHDVLSTEDAIQVMAKSKNIKLDPKLFDFFTQSLHQFKLSGKMTKELPSDFDPCQPQNVLPLQKIEKVKQEKDFGKIKVINNDDQAESDQVNKKKKIA